MKGIGSALIGRLWYFLVRGSCWLTALVLFRIRIVGQQHVPRTGAVLVLSNHQSHLDPVLVGSASKRKLRFLARDTLFVWPLGWLIDSLGAIPIDRESGLSGLRATLRLLKSQEALVLFPEGTRSLDGKLQPLKPGFCAVARRSKATILPTGVSGSFDALPRGRSIPRLSKITVCFGMPIEFADYAKIDDEALVVLVAQRIQASCDSAARRR